MLESKLERYVKNCYPPGNGTEKHAKPSELSYLMYYLQSHRYRISQAAKLLQTKLDRQITKQNKLGNAVVTLEIARELIESCKDDLNVFAQTILEMAQVSLPHTEVTISTTACSMFEEFSRFHDGLLFTNTPYAQLFLHVVQVVADMATKRGAETQQNRDAALKALGILTQSPCIDSETGLQAVGKAVSALYEDARGQPLGASGGASIRGPSDTKTSVGALRALFGSGHSVLAKTTDTVLARSFKDQGDQRWVHALFEHAAQWAQVQLRFTIPKVVVKKMANEPAQISNLADILLVLLRSPVSMVGLDVRVTLSSLLDLQNEHENPKLRTCISALAAHIVYPGQGNDMLNDLLARYAASPDSTPDVSDSQIVNDFDNIVAIVEAGHIEQLSLSPWLSTQWLFNRSDAVIVSYTHAFGAYAANSTTENPKQASQVARQFSQVLLQKHRAAVYIAAYYCLERLVGALGERAVLIAPIVGQLQDKGFRAGAKNGANDSAAAAISSSQALLLAISRASHRKPAEEAYFAGINRRVEIGAWLRGIICPSSGVPIDEAVRAAAKHPPTVKDLAPDVKFSLEQLQMTEEEQAQAQAFDAPIDETVPLGQLDNFKTRARSLADSVTTSGDQRILSGRIPSAQIDAPTVTELRRRATSSQTSLAAHAAEGNTFRPSKKLVGMLGGLNLERSQRGRLVH